MAKFKDLFTAVSFLTIFPTPTLGKQDAVTIGRSIIFFPLAGLIIGIILAVLYYLLKLILPLQVVAVLLITTLAIITGAHHLDGLIDVCDALVVGKTKEQRLNIMSDTRVGTFGIVGVCLLLLLKSVAILNTNALATMIVFPVISRWILCCIICFFPSAKTSGMGFAVKRDASYLSLIIATLITILISVLCIGILGGALVMITSLICTCLIGLIMYSLLSGLNGDCYGALVEISEVAILLVSIICIPISANLPWYNALSIF